MKYFKHFISMLLAVLMLLPVLASCTSTETDTKVNENNEVTAAETTTEAETEPPLPSGVPDNISLDGETISIWYNVGWPSYTDIKGDLEGDILDTAVYQMNRIVEDKLDVSLNLFESGTGQGSCNTDISQLLLAGVTDYDAYMATQWSGCRLVAEGYFMDVSNAPYFSFEQPWWDLQYIKEMSAGKNIYTLIGDYVIDRVRYLTCTYYNKQIYDNYYGSDSSYGTADGMYQRVLDGKWTWDTIRQAAKDVYQDVNGNGEADRSDQLAAMYFVNMDILSSFYCTGARTTERNSENIPEIVLENEHTANVIRDLHELSQKTHGILYITGAQDEEYQKMAGEFSANGSLFMFGTFSTAELLRDMNSDYGIIPFPKYNEEQEKYYSLADEITRFMAIPKLCAKVDSTCAVLEQMAYEGYYNVLPTYYETVLKTKYARDDASGKMLDLIRENVNIDFAFIYVIDYNYIGYLTRELLKKDSSDFASEYARLKGSAMSGGNKLIKSFLENE